MRPKPTLELWSRSTKHSSKSLIQLEVSGLGSVQLAIQKGFNLGFGLKNGGSGCRTSYKPETAPDHRDLQVLQLETFVGPFGLRDEGT